MPLGLARDSMLDLAEMAKKVDDGEFKTSIEISAQQQEGSSDNMVDISPPKNVVGMEYTNSTQHATQHAAEESNTGSCSITSIETSPTSTADHPGLVGGGETKTPDPSDISVNDDAEDRSSIASSSIDSDMALYSGGHTAAAPPSLNGDSSPSKKSNSNNYGRYSGFQNVDYDEYYQPDYTAYSGKNAQVAPNLLGKSESQPLWCCLLPWMKNHHDNKDSKLMIQEAESESANGEVLVDVNTTASVIVRSSSKDADDTSIGSDAFGERLSEKDRQAVLARLRLAQPDEVTTSTTTTTAATATANGGDSAAANNTSNGDSPSSDDNPVTGKKGLLNGISLPPPEVNNNNDDESTATPKQVRGILRQHSRMSRNSLLLSSNAAKQAEGERRRSLFPSYSESTPKKKDLHVNFSPMARVLSVKSHKDMEDEEKGGVWWQKSDYEEFRKTGRMITKAMLEGGSEIWLATNSSWQMPNQNRSQTLKHATNLSERQNNAYANNNGGKPKKNGQISKSEYETTRDKWWHKFGHSRRGLEHIASIDEGRERQGNVRRAIRAVVEENKRQKAFFREDADKVRMVSLQNTTWARDLALAAGASDADAVHTNFNDESRKSREFYLLKFSRAQQSQSHNPQAHHQHQQGAAKKAIPAFMRPATSLKVQANRLDVNTMSQIRYRQKSNKNNSSSSNSKKKVVSAVAATSSSTTAAPIKDSTQPTTATSTTSMAKKAAGFASGEVANMSAVLSGMGPVPKSATTMVGGA